MIIPFSILLVATILASTDGSDPNEMDLRHKPVNIYILFPLLCSVMMAIFTSNLLMQHISTQTDKDTNLEGDCSMPLPTPTHQVDTSYLSHYDYVEFSQHQRKSKPQEKFISTKKSKSTSIKVRTRDKSKNLRKELDHNHSHYLGESALNDLLSSSALGNSKLSDVNVSALKIPQDPASKALGEIEIDDKSTRTESVVETNRVDSITVKSSPLDMQFEPKGLMTGLRVKHGKLTADDVMTANSENTSTINARSDLAKVQLINIKMDGPVTAASPTHDAIAPDNSEAVRSQNKDDTITRGPSELSLKKQEVENVDVK